MPLQIIRQDITKVNCDAIVNAANKSLLGGFGVDGAIHRAAGPELLRECETLGGCEVGQAKLTKGYNLPCKYVIHTVGPVWEGGDRGEKEFLTSCYINSLNLARENGCESIAFPLISTGYYNYPKQEAMDVAVETISEFLLENEMLVYLVVYDKSSYDISKELFNSVEEYIQDNYIDERKLRYETRARRSLYRREMQADFLCCEKCECASFNSLEDMLEDIDECFSVTLLKLIDKKGLSDVECYKRANVSKQTWYKIMNDANYRPSKNTVLAFAIALKLNLEETRHLLSTVGLTLSKSSKFDIIIEYFILNEEYDIFTINETLFKFDQVCLGV